MPEYQVKQCTWMFDSLSCVDILDPRECTIKNLNDLKDSDWIKPFTLSEDFSRLSIHPYIVEENTEKFYLIAEYKDIGRRKIVAIITCSKEEALEVFPEYNSKEYPFYFTDTDMELSEAKARENIKINYLNRVPEYLDHVIKSN